ncbi:hypothetical protein ACIRPT_05205 [Streptomyces sp. NPDC101227]|uniref:hypothetical protein n=1 Tax=Streptomyces sp. NPDC101227 TaxID=3366136 RepID=UPI00382D3B6A
MSATRRSSTTAEYGAGAAARHVVELTKSLIRRPDRFACQVFAADNSAAALRHDQQQPLDHCAGADRPHPDEEVMHV